MNFEAISASKIGTKLAGEKIQRYEKKSHNSLDEYDTT